MEAILYDLDMSIEQFSNFIIDNPSLNIKTVVSDRTKFKTIEDETRLIEPTALQEAIDKAVTEVEEGRAFVRPSGTEDILRIYSEAKTVEETRELGENIKNIIDIIQLLFTLNEIIVAFFIKQLDFKMRRIVNSLSIIIQVPILLE